MEEEYKWEEIFENHQLERTKVEGGWIYRTVVERNSELTCSVGVGLCFVPEPEPEA